MPGASYSHRDVKMEPAWFQKTMCGSYLKGAPLSIPSFMAHHFNGSGDFHIIDNAGVEWPVHVSVNGSRINITSGWCRMVREMALKEGDVVKLEAAGDRRFNITVERCSLRLKEPRTASLKGLLEGFGPGDSMVTSLGEGDEDSLGPRAGVKSECNVAAGLQLLVGAATHLEMPQGRLRDPRLASGRPGAADPSPSTALPATDTRGTSKRKQPDTANTPSPTNSRGGSESPEPSAAPPAAASLKPSNRRQKLAEDFRETPVPLATPATAHLDGPPRGGDSQPVHRAPCDLGTVFDAGSPADLGESGHRGRLISLVAKLDSETASNLSELMAFYDMLENSVTWYSQLYNDLEALVKQAAGDAAQGHQNCRSWINGRVKAFSRNASGLR